MDCPSAWWLRRLRPCRCGAGSAGVPVCVPHLTPNLSVPRPSRPLSRPLPDTGRGAYIRAFLPLTRPVLRAAADPVETGLCARETLLRGFENAPSHVRVVRRGVRGARRGVRGARRGMFGALDSSFILHPSSFILRPSSSVLRPSSSVLRPSSSVLRPPSSVLRPSSSVLRPSSSFSFSC